ncbi:hypothetical protein CTA1_2781 [Colletotrichum tanaceti]|uniref:Uncharacterized protein n=1 Tax=Colletotrichum tanaceti TaxID=1306861 RepID=A0A4U6X855_9PEZI|nr:hypothetical protein CTA1_2781 [Colletotrichum tanaceti]
MLCSQEAQILDRNPRHLPRNPFHPGEPSSQSVVSKKTRATSSPSRACAARPAGSSFFLGVLEIKAPTGFETTASSSTPPRTGVATPTLRTRPFPSTPGSSDPGDLLVYDRDQSVFSPTLRSDTNDADAAESDLVGSAGASQCTRQCLTARLLGDPADQFFKANNYSRAIDNWLNLDC